MRKILDINQFKKIKYTGDKRAILKFTKQNGTVYLNSNALVVLRLSAGEKIVFSDDLQAIKRHDSLEAIELREGKHCMIFNNKAFVNYVFEKFDISDDYTSIRIQIGTDTDEYGWHDLITKSIEKKLKDAK